MVNPSLSSLSLLSLSSQVRARAATGASAADGEGWDDRDRWLLPPVAATGADDDIAAVPAAVITRCVSVCTHYLHDHTVLYDTLLVTMTLS